MADLFALSHHFSCQMHGMGGHSRKKNKALSDCRAKRLFKRWLGVSYRVYNRTMAHFNYPKTRRQAHWIGGAKAILFDKDRWLCLAPTKVAVTRSEDIYVANGLDYRPAGGKCGGDKFYREAGTFSKLITSSGATEHQMA